MNSRNSNDRVRSFWNVAFFVCKESKEGVKAARPGT